MSPKSDNMHEQLCAWLARNASKQRLGVLPETLAATHRNGDRSHMPIGEYSLDAVRGDDEAIAALGMDVLTELQHHAASLAGVQDYDLILYWPTAAGAREPGASHAVRFSGSPAIGALTPTEAPTMQGLTSQLMRHLEAQARINAGLVERQNRLLGDELARKEARIVHLETLRSSQLDAIEQLALHTHERELEVMKTTRAQARLDDGLQALKLLAPPIVATMSKKLGGPAFTAADPELLNVKAWLKSLTHEQLAATLARSTPAQQTALLHAYKALALADEPAFADLSKTDAAPNPNPDEKVTTQ